MQNQADVLKLSDKLKALVMDAQNLQFSDNTFDIIIGRGILHHLPYLKESLEEVRRVLKTGGYAVFSEPLGMNPVLKFYRIMTPKMRTKDEWPFRINEIKIIRNIFPDAEFTYFDFMTLFSKFLYAIKLDALGNKICKKLVALDDSLLRHKRTNMPNLFQKLSWQVVIRLPK